MTVATILTQNADLTLFPQQYIAPSLLWDPRPGHPFIYLTCPESYPNPSYLLKFNRQTLTMTLQVNETHDVWSSLGVPDIDLQGRLYWSAPGGLTDGVVTNSGGSDRTAPFRTAGSPAFGNPTCNTSIASRKKITGWR
jgi:hypothetical protein